MKLIKWAEKKIKKLTIKEFALIKLVLILVGMIIGAYLSAFVKQYILFFITVAVLGYAMIFYTLLGKK